MRFSIASEGKINAGVGQKPDDAWVVPLCGAHHREQHSIGNEQKFWQSYCINPIAVAKALYSASGDMEAADRIIANARTIIMMAG